MTITLPDDMRAEVEAKAAAAGFASVDEYVAALVSEADDDRASPGPPHLTPKTRAELETLLEQSLDSGPPVVADEVFWAERKRDLAAAVGRRRGTTP